MIDRTQAPRSRRRASASTSTPPCGEACAFTSSPPSG